MNKPTQNRFEPIDALRGIAALLVVWQHSSGTFVKQIGVAQHGTFLADIAKDIDFGRIGIICFFLISGFVIPSSLKDNNKSGIKHFVIRRFFRLYPAYWVSILLVVIIALIYNSPPETTTIIANATMIQGLFQKPHLNGLYWTLQVELIFYALCAMLFYFKVLRNDTIIFGLIVLFFGMFVVLQILPFLTGHPLTLHKEIQLLPYLLSIMFLGYLYRKTHDNKTTKNTNNKTLNRFTLISTLMCLGLPVVLLISYLFGYELVAHSFRFGTGHGLGFVLFFAGLLFLKKVPKFMLSLGMISYSLYLFHPLVMKIIVQVTENNTVFQGFHVSLYMAITALISIFLATIIYTLIEKPAINLGHRLTRGK